MHSANTRLAFQNMDGDSEEACKDADKFVLHLIYIKKAFRMTEMGDE